jgi:hypothetical protein
MCVCHGPKQEGVQSAVTAIPQHSSVGANSLTRGPTRVTTRVGIFKPWVGSAGRPGSALTPWSRTGLYNPCAGLAAGSC